MKSIQTIKMISKLKGLTKKEKRKFVGLGIAEKIINSYKFILKSPILLVCLIFMVICTIFEKISNVVDFIFSLFDIIIDKVDHMKTINLCNKEEIDYLKKIIMEEHTHKVQPKDIKSN